MRARVQLELRRRRQRAPWPLLIVYGWKSAGIGEV